jgi:hypothetical protein
LSSPDKTPGKAIIEIQQHLTSLQQEYHLVNHPTDVPGNTDEKLLGNAVKSFLDPWQKIGGAIRIGSSDITLLANKNYHNTVKLKIENDDEELKESIFRALQEFFDEDREEGQFDSMLKTHCQLSPSENEKPHELILCFLKQNSTPQQCAHWKRILRDTFSKTQQNYDYSR